MAIICKTCAGVYDSIEKDGTLYLHACPPLSAPEYKKAVPLWDGKVLPVVERVDKIDENISAGSL